MADISTDINMAESTASTENSETDALDVPLNPLDRATFFKSFQGLTINKVTVQLSKGNDVTADQLQSIKLYLNALDNLTDDEVTPTLKSLGNVKNCLSAIANQLPTTPRWKSKYPEHLSSYAAMLLARFENLQWGEGADQLVDDNSDTDDEPEQKFTAPTSTDLGVVRRAPSNHPIYGEKGMMRGILLRRGGMRTYIFDSSYKRRSPNVLGNNGATNGDWFPLQMAALRDGVHGVKMGGIAGSVNSGAFSVVVSGMYADLDKDLGDIVYYSGSQSHDNKDPVKPQLSNATKALQTSRSTGKPVRLLRSARGHSKYAPSKGLRYDGLYRVVDSEIAKNTHGGAYMRFKLVRVEGQEPIRTDRPTAQEARLCDMIAQGY